MRERKNVPINAAYSSMVMLIIRSMTAYAAVTTYDLPLQYKSTVFTMTVDGRNADVCNPRADQHCVNFDFTGKVTVAVTSLSGPLFQTAKTRFFPGKWGIAPVVSDNGTKLTFEMDQPMQLYLQTDGAALLYIFGNPPEFSPPRGGDPNVIYRGPGLYNEDFDLQSNQTLYLHGGAIVIGSINMLNGTYNDVKVRGRGYLFCNDPSIPTGSDNAYRRTRGSHPILTTGTINRLRVEGVTFGSITRTYTFYLWGVRDSRFENVKIVSDWPEWNTDGYNFHDGYNDTIVDGFIRETDDAFAAVNTTVDNICVYNTAVFPKGDFLRVGFFGQSATGNNISFQNCSCAWWNGTVGGPVNSQWLAIVMTDANDGDHVRMNNLRFEDFLVEKMNLSPTFIYLKGSTEARNWLFRNVTYDLPPSYSSQLPAYDGGFSTDLTECRVFENVRCDNLVIWSSQRSTASAAGFAGGSAADVQFSSSVYPQVPLYKYPSNNDNTVNTNPTLSWNPSKAAESYRVQVSTNPGFSSTVLDQSGITGTSVPLSGLTVGTTYYWRVNSTNPAGASSWPLVFRQFTVSDPTSIAPSPAPRKVLTGQERSGVFDVSNCWGNRLALAVGESSAFTLRIHDPSGKVLCTASGTGPREIWLPSAGTSSGVYFIEGTVGAARIEERVILQR